jgi:hypothetical protein
MLRGCGDPEPIEPVLIVPQIWRSCPRCDARLDHTELVRRLSFMRAVAARRAAALDARQCSCERETLDKTRRDGPDGSQRRRQQ